MQIWVDADACPKAIKEILFRAANRTKTKVNLVSNQPLYIPTSEYITSCVVSAGFDKADMRIVDDMQANDLVITADIPLANAAIIKGGIALNPRGTLYTKDNIKQTLSIRDFHANLRDTGINTGGPAKLGPKEIQMFSNHLDKILTKGLR